MITDHTSLHILRLLETPGVGIARTRAVLDWANENKLDLGTVLADFKVLQGLLTNNQVQELRSNRDRVMEIWSQLQEMRVSLLTFFGEDYPRCVYNNLGKKAPPLLAALGNTSLLNKPSVGFCGSRKPSSKGIETARDCAEQLARQKINIVSGYAAGIDMTTHRTALECGGTTTVVLAEGVLNFKVKGDLKEICDWSSVAVISEFLPGVPWSVRNAMQRNRTICALSQAMILIEAGITGGSIEAGRTCLEMGVPLFAPVYEGMPETARGNRELLGQGARPLHKSRKNGRANVGAVFDALREYDMKNTNPLPRNENVKTASQLKLFGGAKGDS